MPIPLILIHGYSDKGESFQKWKDIFLSSGKYKNDEVQICSYRSLTNEVTIKDIAEGFDRALRINTNLKPGEPFDAIVHSTGMLVLRSWLSVYGLERRQRVKRIIALAPASFGSPLAHKGRSWLGSIFKGNRERGPDFMEAGNLVLDGLELGSRFTWDLAHRDLLGEEVFYGPDETTPYVFTFCGDIPYKGLRGLIANAPGSDGTVRWAGCALNTRKITIDFTLAPDNKRYKISEFSANKRLNLSAPMIPVKDLNHATILEAPSDDLIDLVEKALDVDNKNSYKEWVDYAAKKANATLAGMDKWQQFVIHARDERRDPITDFNLQLYKLSEQADSRNEKQWKPVKMDVHTYSTDNSFRCFHINFADVMGDNPKGLKLEFMASSGTELLGYFEYIPDDDTDTSKFEGQPTFTIDITKLLNEEKYKFFYPYTTTLIEIVLNREPLPLRKVNKVTWFMDKHNLEFRLPPFGV